MTSRARLSWCSLLCLAPLIPLSLRLVRLQVVEHRKLSTLALEQLNRGDIDKGFASADRIFGSWAF